MAALGLDPMQADIEAHYHWIESIVSKCTTAAPISSTQTLDYAPKPTLTARFLTFRGDFPIDFTPEFLEGLTVERLRHIFVALCLHNQHVPDMTELAA